MATPLPLIKWSKTSILTCREHLNSSRVAQFAALDLFVLGYHTQANTLLEAIHNVDLDTMTGDYYGRRTEAQIQGAWKASDTFPQWSSKLVESTSNYEALYKVLPQKVASKLRENTLEIEDVDYVRKRMNTKPDGIYRNPEATVTLGAVIQVALLAGEQVLATKLVETDMKELYKNLRDNWDDTSSDGDELRDWLENRQGLEYCPDIWKLLTTARLGEALGVCVDDVNAFVQEGCALFRQRSTQGPARPYASKYMIELVKMLDDAILRERAADGEGGDSLTLVAPGATEAQLTALEERLATAMSTDDKRVMLPDRKLPDDYKDFLRASNGFPADQYLFSSTDEVVPRSRPANMI